jgi:glycosyltransferase involved in cell wall biosynthesis
MLRIAVFSYGLPVRGEKRGGIERVAHILAEGLAQRGHHVVVFTHDPAPADAAYTTAALPWRRFVNTWLGRRVTMGYLGNVLAILPEYRAFDAIVAHGDSLLLPFTGKPVVRVMHGSALGEALSARSAGRFVLQLGVYLQELVTAAAQRGTVAVSANARRHNPLVRTVIPNAVDLDLYYPDSVERAPAPTVLFVGSLSGRKRGRQLVDAFAQHVRPAWPDARLIVVGEPGPAAPGVTYHTGVDDMELARLYRRAWIYASPSVYEGFGLPYLEAMACGTPVVAVANPGSREVLGDGRYGRLVAASELGRTIAALLGDAAARERLSGAGLARAREYALPQMIDAYESLLQRLVE